MSLTPRASLTVHYLFEMFILGVIVDRILKGDLVCPGLSLNQAQMEE